jgi:hypothetical protein
MTGFEPTHAAIPKLPFSGTSSDVSATPLSSPLHQSPQSVRADREQEHDRDQDDLRRGEAEHARPSAPPPAPPDDEHEEHRVKATGRTTSGAW